MIIGLFADACNIHTQHGAEYFLQKHHEVYFITFDNMSWSIPIVIEWGITSR